MSGLDAGEYTVVETQAPSGYNTVSSFTFQIYPVYKTTGDIDTIRVQTSNANVSDINVYDGVVDLVVKDKAGMSLPLTGQSGVALLWVAGGVMVAVGATHLVRSRKKDKAQQ
ncbi:MAG: SpaA isopeptide-forming pilin-related protein [Eggerthellaceae bacterium]|nr:SpaA isopeptide-forming pilin-related protein [Eggerthellaceae bacterium]